MSIGSSAGAGRDRAAIAAGVLAEVRVRPLLELEVGGVATLVVLAPDVLGVGREALVEPALAPVAARHEITEPLVRELVTDERVDVVVDRGAIVEQHGVGERRGARVLHPAEDEVGDEHLRVARIRIGDAELLREQLEHLRRARERALGRLLLAALDVEHDRRIAPLRLDHREVADGERDEVAAVRDVELPVQRALRAGSLVGDQRAVRQREHRRGDGDLDLARGLLVRCVEAREPVARVFVLALCPRLRRLRRIASVGPHEVQAATRRALVIDRDDKLGTGGGGRGELDAQLLAVMTVRRRLAADGDLVDRQLLASSVIVLVAAIAAARSVAVPATVRLIGSTSSTSARCSMSTTRSAAGKDEKCGEREFAGHAARLYVTSASRAWPRCGRRRSRRFAIEHAYESRTYPGAPKPEPEHDGDLAGIEQPVAQLDVVRDRFCLPAWSCRRTRRIREGVERALRLAARDVRDRAQQLHHREPALVECLAHRLDAILRPGQRLERRDLRDVRRVRRRLALDLVHRADQRRERSRDGGVADAPASHRVRLRHAIDEDRAIRERLRIAAIDTYSAPP